MFLSTKTYGHEIGLSAAFRQWRAKSHCAQIHGYALSVKFEFEASNLDENNWVVDFGGLKELRKWLEEHFDHTLLVAEDDPMRSQLVMLDAAGVARVKLVPSVGCEAFAKMIFKHTERWLFTAGYAPRCKLNTVEVREHGANSAIYKRD